MIGQNISNFQIVQELGSGGMGTVYKAKDTRLNRYVAVKVLHPHVTSHSDAYKRFQNEAMISAQINHPNVTILFDFIEFSGRSYIIMEYVDGNTIDSYIKKEGSFSEATCIDIVLQLLKGLSAAHHLNILHRDIKPGNIIINNKGHVKIMDFGIARMSSATRLTAQNKVIGTAEYIAPEIYLGKDPTRVSDLYSVGIILYEMLSGQVLFKAESEASLIYQVVNQKPKINLSGISPKLVSIVKKLTDKNPKKRYRSTDELIEALENIKKDSKPVSLNKFTVRGTSIPKVNIPKLKSINQFIPEIKLNGAYKFLLGALVISGIIVGIGASSITNKESEPTDILNDKSELKKDDVSLNYSSGNNSSDLKPNPITIEKPKKLEVPSNSPAKINKTKSKNSEEEKNTKQKPKKKKYNESEDRSDKTEKSSTYTKPKSKSKPVTIEIVEDHKEEENQKQKIIKEVAIKEETNIDEGKEESKSIEVQEDSKKLQSKMLFIKEQSLKIRFGKSISSNRVKEGQIVYLESAQQLFTDGHLVIENGAPVKAKISRLKRKNNGKVHLGITIIGVQTKFSEWLTLDYPEYSDIKKKEVIFPESIQLNNVKIKSQQSEILY